MNKEAAFWKFLATQIACRVFKASEVFTHLNDRNKEKLICPFELSANKFDRLTEGEYQAEDRGGFHQTINAKYAIFYPKKDKNSCRYRKWILLYSP